MTTQTTAKSTECILCRLHWRQIPGTVNLQHLSEVFAKLDSVSILGGNESSRFSYFAAEPKEVFEFTAGQKEPFEKLHRILNKYRLQNHDRGDLPKGIFVGGWIGYFGYELGRYIEKLPQTTVDDLQTPLIRLCFYDRLICYDCVEKNCYLFVLQSDCEAETPAEKFAALEKLLIESVQVPVTPTAECDLEKIDSSRVKCNMDKNHYLEKVKRIKRYILDGDVYQVNFSQRFECDFVAPVIELFKWQNKYNPSPYAAYIDSGDLRIVSASPEMFITVHDRVLSTKPIKGTRPRIAETSQTKVKTNAKNFKQLLQSEKEKAELNMIIDLERNDLGRICEYGSIKVVQQRTIESYPTVFHAVATIEGKVQQDICFCDILKAMFPGGSITGAPKISAMTIIDELEPTARGIYTGSIGFIGLDGTVCLNIAIRTIIINGQKAFAQVGGGIVADSNPEAEWDETLVKAKALVAGINSVR